MPEKEATMPVDKKECQDHHCYKVSLNGQLIVCAKCGRIKGVRDGESWKVLY